MTRFRSSLVANFVGVSSTAAMQLACVPFYIALMGVEAYGLVGFYLTLRASVQILDLGLSPTMSREMARYSVRPGSAGEMRDLVRTLEVGYWCIGLVLGVSIALFAPLIATSWINADALPPRDVTRAVAMMGLLVALQWPLSFYQGGLMGLNRQVRLNAIRVLAEVLNGGGSVLLLYTVSSGVLVFFTWQCAVAMVQLLLITTSLWACLPAAERAARFDVHLIHKIKDFAAGMSGIALFGMILTQMDKVALSRLLSLQGFGYYVLAGTMVNGLQLFINPLFQAIFPRLAALVANNNEADIKRLYHQGSQLMAGFVFPAAAVLAFFPHEILAVWTGSVETANATAPIVKLLVWGTAINGVMHLPYALQLAYGWTRIALIVVVGKVIVFLPLLLAITPSTGATGAAAVWSLLNIAYLVVTVPLTHRRLLRGEAVRWLFVDIAWPVLIALGVVVALRLMVDEPASRVGTLFTLGAITCTTLFATICLTPGLRTGVFQAVQRSGA